MSLQLAIKVSSALPTIRGQQRIAAVIIDKRGRVLSIGVNSYKKTNPLMKSYAIRAGNPEAQFLHAEVAALIGLNHNDKQKAYKISIARALKTNQTGLAAPCPICQLALKDTGIKVVEYTM
jgi:deoxycytidylate deaminase